MERVRLPVIDTQDSPSTPPAASLRRRPLRGELRYRFQFASLLRLSDNLVRKAVTAYDRLFLLEQRDEAEIYLDMGLEFARDGKLSEAFEAIRKAAAVKPDDPTPLVQLGMLHMRRGAWDAAVQELERVKTLGLADHRVHMHLAEALTRLEKHEMAAEELENALRLRQDLPDIPYRLGVALSRIGRHDEAVEAFELAIELAPENVVYHQSLGFALESASRRSEAVQCFKRALELEHAASDDAE